MRYNFKRWFMVYLGTRVEFGIYCMNRRIHPEDILFIPTDPNAHPQGSLDEGLKGYEKAYCYIINYDQPASIPLPIRANSSSECRKPLT